MTGYHNKFFWSASLFLMKPLNWAHRRETECLWPGALPFTIQISLIGNWVGFKPVRLNGTRHLRLCSTRAVQPIEGDHFTKEYTLADIIFWKKVVLAC